MARFKADEVVPVRTSWKVALNNAAHHVALLSDQSGKRRSDKKPALGHETELH
jgi:hypothetical protein